jgi:hypothetical protein
MLMFFTALAGPKASARVTRTIPAQLESPAVTLKSASQVLAVGSSRVMVRMVKAAAGRTSANSQGIFCQTTLIPRFPEDFIGQ